jgi:hypothetical protein
VDVGNKEMLSNIKDEA